MCSAIRRAARSPRGASGRSRSATGWSQVDLAWRRRYSIFIGANHDVPPPCAGLCSVSGRVLEQVSAQLVELLLGDARRERPAGGAAVALVEAVQKVLHGGRLHTEA